MHPSAIPMPDGEVLPCAGHGVVPAVRRCAGCGLPYCENCLVEFLRAYYCGSCRDLKLVELQSAMSVRGLFRRPAWASLVTTLVLHLLIALPFLLGILLLGVLQAWLRILLPWFEILATVGILVAIAAGLWLAWSAFPRLSLLGVHEVQRRVEEVVSREVGPGAANGIFVGLLPWVQPLAFPSELDWDLGFLRTEGPWLCYNGVRTRFRLAASQVERTEIARRGAPVAVVVYWRDSLRARSGAFNFRVRRVGSLREARESAEGLQSEIEGWRRSALTLDAADTVAGAPAQG